MIINRDEIIFLILGHMLLGFIVGMAFFNSLPEVM